MPGLEYTIKGSTLTRIFEDFLPHVPEEYDNIVKGLNEFEGLSPQWSQDCCGDIIKQGKNG